MPSNHISTPCRRAVQTYIHLRLRQIKLHRIDILKWLQLGEIWLRKVLWGALVVLGLGLGLSGGVAAGGVAPEAEGVSVLGGARGELWLS